MRCPKGYIPMRRITLDEMVRFKDLKEFFSKRPITNSKSSLLTRKKSDSSTHRYASGRQFINNMGGFSILNVWSPVAGFSISQQWYHGGENEGNQTVEQGWIVYPNKFGMNEAVLFIYYTPDNYETGCYNLDCPSFIQVDERVYLGAPFDAYSVSGGEQRYFYLGCLRDPDTGNWWLLYKGSEGWIKFGYYAR